MAPGARRSPLGSGSPPRPSPQMRGRRRHPLATAWPGKRGLRASARPPARAQPGSSRCASGGRSERPRGPSSGPFLSPVAVEGAPVSAAQHLSLPALVLPPSPPRHPHPEPRASCAASRAGLWPSAPGVPGSRAYARPRVQLAVGLRAEPAAAREADSAGRGRRGCCARRDPQRPRSALCGPLGTALSWPLSCVLGAGAFPGLFRRQLSPPPHPSLTPCARARPVGVGRRYPVRASGVQVSGRVEVGGEKPQPLQEQVGGGDPRTTPGDEPGNFSCGAGLRAPRARPRPRPQARVPSEAPTPRARSPLPLHADGEGRERGGPQLPALKK